MDRSRATFSCDTQSVKQTEQLGDHIGRCASAGLVVLLVGPLGAGKTALARGIARGLGYKGYVRSPTFTLIHHYSGRLPMFHFDLYRLENSMQLEALGFEEYFYGDGISVVEWADRLSDIWPENRLLVRLNRPGGDSENYRKLDMKAQGALACEVVECIRASSDSPARGPSS